MRLEAIVHPTSISKDDPLFDPAIHIAVEVLASKTFHDKMIGLPVTAYHHDTMKAIHILNRRRHALTADNMRRALIELNGSLPGPLELARKLLKTRKVPATAANIWQVLPEVIASARGPGVLGSVTKFWREGNAWLVAIEIDKSRISAFQLKLITKGGALGEVSLTHAVLDGTIEPLELSFTIKGLRTGSAINRIVSASHYTKSNSIFFFLKEKEKEKEKEKGKEKEKERKKMDIETVNNQPEDEIRSFYNELGAIDPALQSKFLHHMKEVGVVQASMRTVNSDRLDELEKAMAQIIEATASALNEVGPACFGNIRPRTTDEWKTNVKSLATANEFILAAAANSLGKRKRENDELEDALKDLSSGQRVIAASSKVAKHAAEVKQPDDDFFRELRNMRQALKNLN
jgi:hypothetical protein